MEAKRKRNILDGGAFDHLFPEANLSDETIKKGATVEDTLRFIPQVVEKTKWQTKKIAKKLKGDSVYETCGNIWQFVYDHIRYHKDKEGLEQIRSPARAWHDRKDGVDCDCYSVFISSILTNLRIPHVLRIAKYKKDYFQHIYPIVPLNDEYITIDCVVDHFDYEEPYSEIKDTPMDLQYLDGFDEPRSKNTDAIDLFGDEELGKLFKNNPFKKVASAVKSVVRKVAPKAAAPGEKPKSKIGNFLKKGLNVINKLNPATMALRNGVLAAMKLNVFKIAQRLKWAYLTESAAQKKNLDMARWKRLVAAKDKLENIFFGAGGKKENFKKAILTGKGNKNREVAGLLGYVPDSFASYMNESTPLPQLLGEEIFYSENIDGMEGLEGLGELGEPFTAATITAASGVLAAISGLLKNIGSIFKKKEPGSEDFEETASEDAAAATAEASYPDTLPALPGGSSAPFAPAAYAPESGYSEGGSEDYSSGNYAPALRQAGDSTDEGSGDTSEDAGFWEKNKKWLKPTLFGVGGLGALFIGYKLIKGKKSPQTVQGSKPMAGLKSKRTRKRKTTTKTSGKKKPVALI